MRGAGDDGCDINDVPYVIGDSPVPDDDEENPKASICCLQGCLAGTAVGFGFFVALPSGILLVIYSINKNDVPLLSVGGVLVSLPVLMLIIVVVLCLNQQRLARLRKNKVRGSKVKDARSKVTDSRSNLTDSRSKVRDARSKVTDSDLEVKLTAVRTVPTSAVVGSTLRGATSVNTSAEAATTNEIAEEISPSSLAKPPQRSVASLPTTAAFSVPKSKSLYTSSSSTSSSSSSLTSSFSTEEAVLSSSSSSASLKQPPKVAIILNTSGAIPPPPSQQQPPPPPLYPTTSTTVGRVSTQALNSVMANPKLTPSASLTVFAISLDSISQNHTPSIAITSNESTNPPLSSSSTTSMMIPPPTECSEPLVFTPKSSSATSSDIIEMNNNDKLNYSGYGLATTVPSSDSLHEVLL